ncbi:MAG TPA: hypothetical protein VFM55_09395 [Micromonosporaceae bacterium]|nr:hypothetical protein [Micromonosporaceae bacterium]
MLVDDRLDGGGEGGRGVAGDRDADGDLFGERVVAHVKVEGVVDAPLLIFWESDQVDLLLGEQVEEADVHWRGHLLLADGLGEKLFFHTLLGDGDREAGLDPGAPCLVHVRVAGWLEAGQFLDQVLLALLEFGDLGDQRRLTGIDGRIGGGCGH